MKNNGFGAKGYTKSSTQTSGVKTYAQNFGSIRSAFSSIIPYTTNLKIWTTLDQSTITTTTSGSTTIVNKWTDIVNEVAIGQTSTASMPTIDQTYAIGVNSIPGIRFITDDLLTGSTFGTTNNAYITFGVYLRSNTDKSVSTFYITAPHAQAGVSQDTYYAFRVYAEGSTLKRYFEVFTYNMAGGNKGTTLQPFTGNADIKYYANDYIYYFTMGTDTNRNFYTYAYDKDGNTLFSNTTTYLTFLGVDNTGSWDSVFGGPSGPIFPGLKAHLGKSAVDNVYYTTINFGSDSPPTANNLQKITQYLESAYGKVMT
jgi:hypothetical protein